MESIARRLLSLPGGIHFRTLNLSMLLVSSVVRPFGSFLHTENLYLFPAGLASALVDLSKATKLKDVTFQVNSPSVSWIATVLRTITPKHRDFRQISISIPYNSFQLHRIWPATQETIRRQGLDLDRLLVQIWESHSIHPRMTCGVPAWDEEGVKGPIDWLLPEVARRGIMDLVE